MKALLAAQPECHIRDLAQVGIEEAAPDVFGLGSWLDYSCPGWRNEADATTKLSEDV